MKLFLSGGGSEEKSEEIDKLFAESLDKTKPLLYIPIAMDTAVHSYPACLKWIKNCFGRFGIKKIVMWTESDLKIAKAQDFNKFSGVHIGGGNTFKLLKELKEFEIVNILKKIAKKNVPIYGGSAGAIILGKTILTASFSDENYVGLKEFGSLNLIKDHDIWAHYDFSKDKNIFEYQSNNKSKVIAIPEDAGIYVDEYRILVVGKSSVYMFKQGKKEIKPGKYIRIS